jgi:hypothetical protein
VVRRFGGESLEICKAYSTDTNDSDGDPCGVAANHVESWRGSRLDEAIAAPMIGGVISSFLLELMVYPAIYKFGVAGNYEEAGSPKHEATEPHERTLSNLVTRRLIGVFHCGCLCELSIRAGSNAALYRARRV